MALTIGSTAPDFEAETTEGRINFYDWLGDSWAVLFSHPRNFTPVCTTELGYMASIKPEFDKRGVKIIGLSVDPMENHEQWAKDIEETQGTAPNYPLIADTDFNVSKVYGMLRPSVEGDPTKRTPAENQTVRNVFVIGPDKKVKLLLVYPMTTGRNFDEVLRVIDSLQLTANHKVATPAQWQQGDDVIIAGSVSDDAGEELFPAAGRRRSPTSGSSRSPAEVRRAAALVDDPGGAEPQARDLSLPVLPPAAAGAERTCPRDARGRPQAPPPRAHRVRAGRAQGGAPAGARRVAEDAAASPARAPGGAWSAAEIHRSVDPSVTARAMTKRHRRPMLRAWKSSRSTTCTSATGPRGRPGRVVRGRRGRDLRDSRPQRRRQDHHRGVHRGAPGAATAGPSACSGTTPRRPPRCASSSASQLQESELPDRLRVGEALDLYAPSTATPPTPASSPPRSGSTRSATRRSPSSPAASASGSRSRSRWSATRRSPCSTS